VLFSVRTLRSDSDLSSRARAFLTNYMLANPIGAKAFYPLDKTDDSQLSAQQLIEAIGH